MSFWLMLLVRAFAAVVALFLVRESFSALRGRTVVIPGDMHVYRGWTARLFGVMALFFALFLALFALYVEIPEGPR